jgi:cytochrome b561
LGEISSFDQTLEVLRGEESVAGYSATQVALQWLIVVAVLFQLVFGESMTKVVEALEEGGA